MTNEFTRDVEWLEPSARAQWSALEALLVKSGQLDQQLGQRPQNSIHARWEAETTDRSWLERKTLDELRGALVEYSLAAKNLLLWITYEGAVDWQIAATLSSDGGRGTVDVRLHSANLEQIDIVFAELDRWWRSARPGSTSVPDDWGWTRISSFELQQSEDGAGRPASKLSRIAMNPWTLGIGVAVVGAIAARLFGIG